MSLRNLVSFGIVLLVGIMAVVTIRFWLEPAYTLAQSTNDEQTQFRTLLVWFYLEVIVVLAALFVIHKTFGKETSPKGENVV